MSGPTADFGSEIPDFSDPLQMRNRHGLAIVLMYLTLLIRILSVGLKRTVDWRKLANETTSDQADRFHIKAKAKVPLGKRSDDGGQQKT